MFTFHVRKTFLNVQKGRPRGVTDFYSNEADDMDDDDCGGIFRNIF